jgi:hypothetical protein
VCSVIRASRCLLLVGVALCSARIGAESNHPDDAWPNARIDAGRAYAECLTGVIVDRRVDTQAAKSVCLSERETYRSFLPAEKAEEILRRLESEASKAEKK